MKDVENMTRVLSHKQLRCLMVKNGGSSTWSKINLLGGLSAIPPMWAVIISTLVAVALYTSSPLRPAFLGLFRFVLPSLFPVATQGTLL